MMKERLLTITLILSFLFVFFTRAFSTETWTPGVSKGDFFCYEMYGVFTSSDSYDVIEVPSFEQNNTDRVRIDIAGVSGSIILQIYTLYFENVTEKFELKTDLDPSNTGELSFSERGVPICAANLEVGDSLSTVELTVNETLSRSYLSGERETNYVSWNTPLDYGACYFDKKTGILVELNRTHIYTNPMTDKVITKADIVKMIDSSFWSAQEIPLLVRSPIIAVATLGFWAISGFCCRKRKK